MTRKLKSKKYLSDKTNQNLMDNGLILEVENLANSSKDIPSLENNITNFKKFHSLKDPTNFCWVLVILNQKLFSFEPIYEEELQQNRMLKKVMNCLKNYSSWD